VLTSGPLDQGPRCPCDLKRLHFHAKVASPLCPVPSFHPSPSFVLQNGRKDGEEQEAGPDAQSPPPAHNDGHAGRHFISEQSVIPEAPAHPTPQLDPARANPRSGGPRAHARFCSPLRAPCSLLRAPCPLLRVDFAGIVLEFVLTLRNTPISLQSTELWQNARFRPICVQWIEREGAWPRRAATGVERRIFSAACPLVLEITRLAFIAKIRTDSARITGRCGMRFAMDYANRDVNEDIPKRHGSCRSVGVSEPVLLSSAREKHSSVWQAWRQRRP